MHFSKKHILITIYDRTDKIHETLASLQSIYNIDQYELVFVRQEETSSDCKIVENIINSIKWIKVHQITTSYQHDDSSQKKINLNIITGFKYCFEDLKSQFVLFIEDDVLLGFDSLYFAEKMTKKYQHSPFFKSVSLGSTVEFKEGRLYEYCKLMNGISKGWIVTSRTWPYIKRIWPKTHRTYYDAILRHHFRNGFVITPINSRSLDIGWGSKALNTSEDPTHTTYTTMKKCWVGNKAFDLKPYKINKTINFRTVLNPHYICPHFNFINWTHYFILRLFRKLAQLSCHKGFLNYMKRRLGD